MRNESGAEAWIVAAVALVALLATNTVFFAIDIPLGWSLRGSTFATATDVWMRRALDVACVVALVINLGVPVGLAIVRRWRGLVGVLVAWVATPVACIAGMAIDFALARALA